MRPHGALSFANSQLVADVASKAFTEADLDESGAVDFAECVLRESAGYQVSGQNSAARSPTSCV